VLAGAVGDDDEGEVVLVAQRRDASPGTLPAGAICATPWPVLRRAAPQPPGDGAEEKAKANEGASGSDWYLPLRFLPPEPPRVRGFGRRHLEDLAKARIVSSW
jgi:hypothetical protein